MIRHQAPIIGKRKGSRITISIRKRDSDRLRLLEEMYYQEKVIDPNKIAKMKANRKSHGVAIADLLEWTLDEFVFESDYLQQREQAGSGTMEAT